MLSSALSRKEIQGRGDTCIHIADPFCCRVETNNILKQIYSGKKLILKSVNLKYSVKLLSTRGRFHI